MPTRRHDRQRRHAAASWRACSRRRTAPRQRYAASWGSGAWGGLLAGLGGIRDANSRPLCLPVAPRLASWNKTGDPDQLQLARYLDEADALLQPHYEQLSGPLALRLDVGLPQNINLLDQRDLDNYLLPQATRLSQHTHAALACVWGTKQHADSSFARIEQANPPRPPRHSIAATPSGQPHPANRPSSRSRSEISSPKLHRFRRALCGYRYPSPSATPKLAEPVEADYRCPRPDPRARLRHWFLGAARRPDRGSRPPLPR